MWMARFSTAMAASLTASDMVGWAWQVRARSSEEPPNSITTAASWISSPAPGADDMHAEHLVGLGIGQHLDEAVRVPHGARAAVGHEGELADLVGAALGLERFLALADRRDFRHRVDHGRDHL